jgi:hypothetical protein
METTIPAGLCATCRHHQAVLSGKGSVFHRCRLADTDDRFPRYPRLPVLVCDGYETEAGETGPASPGPA